MSFLQKRSSALAGADLCYKAAVTAAFLLYAACGDPGFAQAGNDAGRNVLLSEDESGRAEASGASAADYAWPGLKYDSDQTIARRIPPPPGARRVPLNVSGAAGPEAVADSFGFWLRHLPLKPGRPTVHLHDGRAKANQTAHHAVIDIDTGARNLQQCADAIMRLRSEYLYARKQSERIRFRFTDESEARYDLWARGFRPRVRQGRKTRWTQRAPADDSYAGFRSYLQNLFTYAGTYSLSRESRPVHASEVRVGDFLIQGGFPGHAVLVVDMAEARAVDEVGRRARYVLLAQSYMPAQDMHVLRNPAGDSPWYILPEPSARPSRDSGGRARPLPIKTPEWNFTTEDWMRFRN